MNSIERVVLSAALIAAFEGVGHAQPLLAPTPPMGWNSWDSFGTTVTEDEVKANADYMAKNLKSHGYDLITVDIQWYEPTAHTGNYKRGAILETDDNGRLRPAPNRFSTDTPRVVGYTLALSRA